MAPGNAYIDLKYRNQCGFYLKLPFISSCRGSFVSLWLAPVSGNTLTVCGACDDRLLTFITSACVVCTCLARVLGRRQTHNHQLWKYHLPNWPFFFDAIHCRAKSPLPRDPVKGNGNQVEPYCIHLVLIILEFEEKRWKESEIQIRERYVKYCYYASRTSVNRR